MPRWVVWGAGAAAVAVAFLFAIGYRASVWYPSVRCSMNEPVPSATEVVEDFISTFGTDDASPVLQLSGSAQHLRLKGTHVPHLSSGDNFLYYYANLFPDSVDFSDPTWIRDSSDESADARASSNTTTTTTSSAAVTAVIQTTSAHSRLVDSGSSTSAQTMTSGSSTLPYVDFELIQTGGPLSGGATSTVQQGATGASMVSLSATTIPGPKSGSAGNGAAASLSPAAARGEESSFGEQMRRWGKFVVGDRRDEIVHAEVGPYDGCHETTKKMVWIHMVGHLRSFESRQHNLKAFRDALPCSMLVIYTMDHIEGTGAAWWGNREQLAGANANSDVLALLERLKKSESSALGTGNFAVAVEKRKDRNDQTGMLTLDSVLLELVRERLGIPADERSVQHVYIRTRPDVLATHAVDADRLFELDALYHGTSRGWAILTPHESGRVSGWDPSELFAVFSRSFYLRLAARFSIEYFFPQHRNASPKHVAINPGSTFFGCCQNEENEKVSLGFKGNSPDCGHGWAANWLHGEGRRSDLFWLRPDLKIHILRISGEQQVAVNRPGNAALIASGPPNGPLPRMDITKNGLVVLGGRNCKEIGRKQREPIVGLGARKFLYAPLLANTYAYSSERVEADFLKYAKESNIAYGIGMWGYLGIRTDQTQ